MTADVVDFFSLESRLTDSLDSLPTRGVPVCPSLLLERLLVVLTVLFLVVPRLPCQLQILQFHLT
jgi:hypothetical protein